MGRQREGSRAGDGDGEGVGVDIDVDVGWVDCSLMAVVRGEAVVRMGRRSRRRDVEVEVEEEG